MRIALVLPEHPSARPCHGIGTAAAALDQALRTCGTELLVLVADRQGGWSSVEGPVSWPTSCPEFLLPIVSRAWIRRQLRTFAPDVVEYSNWGGLACWPHGPWPRVVRLSSPLALMPAEDPLRALVRPLRLQAERRTVRQAHLVISDSQAMAGVSERVYGRKADCVIPHGVASRSAEAHIHAPSPAVLCVGRLEPRKGTDVLITAWQQVRQRIPDAVLHLVGGDPFAFGARCLQRLGSDGIVVHGRLDDAALSTLRTQCPIATMPSRFESFGLAVLEAWDAGQAVVTSDGGALPEVVGDAGLIVPAGDHRCLADALIALLTDAPRQRTLASAGHRRLTTRFSAIACAQASLEAYARARQLR